MADQDRRARERALVLGFLDRAQRALYTPGGPVEPTPNRISLIIDEAVRGGIARVTRDSAGRPYLGLSGSADAQAAFRGRISAALEDVVTQTDRGVALFYNAPQSDWREIIDNSPCVFDPTTNQIAALSIQDLESTLGRLGELEAATTIRDANLAYVKRGVTENGGMLRKNGEGQVFARFATAAGAERIRPELEKARTVDPKRFEAVVRSLHDHPLLREHMLPGVEPTGIESSVPLDRASFDAFSDRAREAYRRLIQRNQQFARNEGQAELDERLASQSGGQYQSARNVGTGIQTDLGGVRRGAIEDELASMSPSTGGIENSVDRQNRQTFATLRLRRNQQRAEESQDLATIAMVEAERLAGRIQNDIDRNPETTPYRRRTDLKAQMERDAERVRKGDLPAARAWLGHATMIGTFNMVVVNAAGAYDIVPYFDIKQNCVGLKAHNEGRWSEGIPNEKTLGQWASLEAPLQISMANDGRPGLRVFGERPQTLIERARKDANPELSFEETLAAEEASLERLYAADSASTRANAIAVAKNAFGLPADPIVYGVVDLQESVKVTLGDGEEQTIAMVPYRGVLVAKGLYHSDVYHDGAIYEHLTSAIGEHKLGTFLSISYEAGSQLQWANVTRETGDQTERVAETVREFVGRFDERVSEEKYRDHLEQQAPLALSAAAVLAPEATISLALPDPEQAQKPLTFEGSIVHATPLASFVFDEERSEVAPIRHDVVGKTLSVGDEAAFVVSRAGSAIVRHTPAEQVIPSIRQARSIEALRNAEAVVHQKQELEALSDRLKVGPENLVALDVRDVRAQNRRNGNLIVEHALSTNHTVYGTVPFADGKFGYVALPAWDKFGDRSVPSWEMESVGYARVDVNKAGRLKVEPLLPSERDELKLPQVKDVPRLTLLAARLKMQGIADPETLEITEARIKDASFPARLVARDAQTVALDVSSAAEPTIRTHMLLDRSQIDLDLVDSIAEGEIVTLSVADSVISLDAVRDGKQRELEGPRNEQEHELREQLEALQNESLSSGMAAGGRR
jgi:hypothetical protein